MDYMMYVNEVLTAAFSSEFLLQVKDKDIT